MTLGVAAAVVAAIIGLTVGVWFGCQTRIARLRRWMRENKRIVSLMSSQLTTFAVTVQTGILINENHEAAGGSDPPPIYSKFLSLFEFMTLKFTLLPLGCINPNFSYFGVLVVQVSECVRE